MIRIGSMCSGYGGLELGVQMVLGGTVAWHAEVDPDASRVLRHHWPDAPNYGDLKSAPWETVEPVDVLCAGFPCQPVSQAGQRAGITDERWLFDDICDAIGRMVAPPRMLVFENVIGLLSADGGRAMARVVEGLAVLGYMGSWRTLRACDAGAPHRRRRLFVVASREGSADPAATAQPHGSAGSRQGRDWPAPDPEFLRRATRARSDQGESRRVGWGGLAHGDLPTDQTPASWEPYSAAIERWERLTRPAPAAANERCRVNPRFTEWLMGLPMGFVTDVIPGRLAQLRCLGNGVVPLQAAVAIIDLLRDRPALRAFP